MILCVCPNPSVDKYVWVKNFTMGKVNRTIREKSFPGGKGIHVAMGVKELGLEVAVLGFWAGSTGKWVKEACESMDIRCYGPELSGETRTCLTFKAEDDFNDTELLGTGPVVGKDDLAKFIEQHNQLAAQSEIISYSGSWPPSDAKASYASLVSSAREMGKPTIVDCSGSQLTDVLKEKPFAVHINQSEGQEVFNTEDPFELTEKITAHCDMSAVTCGAEGLYLSDGDDVVHALSKVDKVISTVGCGDSLMAGLIAGAIRQLDLMDTARLAAVCGAANCVREELGMFYLKDVDMLQESCEIKNLNVNKP
ncbi:MAG: hexose kinase [Cyclobacteriaceae bacterium]|nr:hexose kinase [Cyclobacteriaceae bacterium SS2]